MSKLEDRRGAREGLSMSASGKAQLAAAVDLGASKAACFILKSEDVRRADRTLRHIAGVGYVQSRGVKNGAIVDLNEAADAVALAVERAERQADCQVRGVTVTTSGGQLASHRVEAQASLGAKPITDQDLTRAIASGLAQIRFPNRKPIHILPTAWSVDGLRGVRDPRGMMGRQLGLEMLVVTMNESAFHTLHACMELARVQLDGVVAAPFAAGLAALDDEEMDLGAVCIDMGGGSTSVAVFGGGSLLHVDSLSVGGGHVTADVARGLSTSLTGAERIKVLHGSAIASANEDRETIEAPPRGDDPGAGPIMVPKSILKNVIAPRVEETLELVRERLKAAGAPIEPGAGVVLTGGASQLAGVRELAYRLFDRPVRLGLPRRVPHLADAASGPAFCAAAGVLQRAAFGPREAVSSRALLASRIGPRDAPQVQGGVVAKAAAWLRENL
jgi:cell division protein FtsA